MIRKLKNIAHGLIAIAANLRFGFPARQLIVIGVTGTDGKTTTSTLIYHILKESGKRVALVTSVSAKIGKEELDTGFHVTTPDPWPLQKLIRKIVNNKFEYLVLETTSHGLDQHRLLGVPFTIGVITNVTHEHLDYHKDYDQYLQAKAKLLLNAKHPVLNQDDSSYKQLKKQLKGKKVHTYSLKKAKRPILACIKNRFSEVFNWSNSYAAFTAVSLLDVDPKAFCKAIETFHGIKGRMEHIKNSKDLNIYIDFAHTPNALKNALKALRSKVKGQKSKVIAVYGSAGHRDHKKRPQMGKIGSRLADIVILTAEDPRTEDVGEIIIQMRKGATGKAKIIVEPDRQQAISRAIKIANKKDIIGIFGKGHESSMCFGKIEYPWSDHEAVTKAIKQENK